MKLTQDHIKKLIKEELEQLFEQGKQYYITIPDDGWAILSDESGKEVSNLWTALDHVRDPVNIHGDAKNDYIHSHLLNQYWDNTNQPQQKTKEWWQNIYHFFRRDTDNLSADEESRFSNHPNVSPSQLKSLAGVFSLFKRIPLENISFIPAALPVDGGGSSASSFSPTKPAKQGLGKQLSNLFGRRNKSSAGSETPTIPAGPAGSTSTVPAIGRDTRAAAFVGGNKAF